MPSELRVIVWLGLAVAVWLFLVPTSSADGSSCGTPMLRTDEATAIEKGFDEGCGERNRTRATQGWMTLLGSGALYGGGRAWGALRPPRPVRAPRERGGIENPRSYYE